MAKLPTMHKANQPIAHTKGMRITFGKHKDKFVEDVLRTDPSWLAWAHENVQWFRLEEELYRAARSARADERLERLRARRLGYGASYRQYNDDDFGDEIMEAFPNRGLYDF